MHIEFVSGWAERCPTRITDHTGYYWKSSVSRIKKPITKLMAKAIAARLMDGFFPYLIAYELEIEAELINKAQMEWPNEFKAIDVKTDKRVKGTNHTRSRRTFASRSRVNLPSGTLVLFES